MKLAGVGKRGKRVDGGILREKVRKNLVAGAGCCRSGCAAHLCTKNRTVDLSKAAGTKILA